MTRATALLVVLAGCGLDAVGTGPSAPADRSGLPPSSGTGPGEAPPLATRGPLCAPDPSLLACYAFEDAMTDASGKGTEPLRTTNLQFTEGHEGRAGRFTTSPKADVRLPHAMMNTNQMTLELWFRADALPASGDRFVLVDLDGRAGITIGATGKIGCNGATSLSTVVAARWMHVACVLEANRTKLYVGGSFEIERLGASFGRTSVWVGVGQDSDSTGDNFVGAIDSLRIWTTLLDDARIANAAAR